MVSATVFAQKMCMSVCMFVYMYVYTEVEVGMLMNCRNQFIK